MIIKFGNIELLDWEAFSIGRWERNVSADTWAPISLIRGYPYRQEDDRLYTWYPEFVKDFAFLQPIFNKSTNYKEFESKDIKEAMEYVDQFLIRMANLKSFI